jgi:2,3-bisphosphoglycerate-dependent phosphoglycerate mutase
MTILLVRHGETAGNAARILQRADVPLNERGLRQAECLADRLAAHGCVHVLCSDLLRARMTAAPLLSRPGMVHVTLEESPLLQERNFGDLRGTPYAQLREDPFGPDFAPPNGETWDMFHERVEAAFALIGARRRQLQGDLVVVTHGLVCRAILQRHVSISAGQEAPRSFDNTGVTSLGPEPPHAIALMNCTRHLVGDLAPPRDLGAA